MPREDFVTECMESVDQIRDVVETQISGPTLQNFMIKMKPVIYTAFCATMMGLKHPRNNECVAMLSDVDKTLMAVCLNRELQIITPISSYDVRTAYASIKLVHGFAKDPDGEQIANYISLCTKAIWIGRSILGKTKIPKQLDDFFKGITKGEVETTRDFIQSMSEKQGDANSALAGLCKRNGRLSTWHDKSKWSTIMPEFTLAVRTYCIAQRRSTNTSMERLAQMFISPVVPGRQVSTEDKIFYENCANQDISPFWLFLDNVPPEAETLIDPSSLVTLQSFDDLFKITQVQNKRSREQLLKFKWMKNSWNAMSTIIVLHNPFTGQHHDWVEKQSIRYWSRLKKQDFNQSTNVMQFFLEEIKVRKIKMAPHLCQIFVKFINDINLAINPAPELQTEADATEEDQRQKAMLQRQIEESVRPLEGRMKERREQLQSLEESKDDSGVILPILLLGLGIFLLSR